MKQPLRQYGTFVASAAGLTLLLIALGVWPTSRLAGPEALGALVVGCFVGFAACALSTLPAALMEPTPGNAVLLSLAGIGIRFGVVAVAAVVLVLTSGLPTAPLLIWIGFSYLALLPLETRFILRSAADHKKIGARESGPLEIS